MTRGPRRRALACSCGYSRGGDSDLRHLAPDLTYRMHVGIAAGMRRRGGVGGRNALAALGVIRERPDREVEYLRGRDLGGRVVFDIGAYQGMYTLFFASRVGARGEVVAFEPHPDNFDRLVTNVALNAFHNVTALPVGVAAEPGDLTFTTSADPGRTSANPDIGAGADRRCADVERTRDVRGRRARSASAPHARLRQDRCRRTRTRRLEGHAANAGRALCGALHRVARRRVGAQRSNSAAVAALLLEAGYSLVHVESGTPVPTPAAAPPEGHISAWGPRSLAADEQQVHHADVASDPRGRRCPASGSSPTDHVEAPQRVAVAAWRGYRHRRSRRRPPRCPRPHSDWRSGARQVQARA